MLLQLWSKSSLSLTWPWHDNRGRTTVSWCRAEVRSPFTAAALNHYNEPEWKSSRDDLSRGFLATVISFAGSQIRANKRRQVLASAVCYGSLTYTGWKGSLLKHGWRNKDKNEKRQKSVWIFFPFRKWIYVLAAVPSTLWGIFGVKRLGMRRQEDILFQVWKDYWTMEALYLRRIKRKPMRAFDLLLYSSYCFVFR